MRPNAKENGHVSPSTAVWLPEVTAAGRADCLPCGKAEKEQKFTSDREPSGKSQISL